MTRTPSAALSVIVHSRRIIVAIGCAVLAIPLAAYAYMGSFMRYSGDDYCYAAVLVRNGFAKTQWESYLRIST